MSNRGKRTTAGDDEVKQLLRAAQDDMLLKLTLNSHITSSSSSSIDPDLDRRFQALKNPTNKIDGSLKKDSSKPDTAAAAAVKDKVDTGDGDDLLARFAALKNSIPSNNKTDVSNNTQLGEKDESEEEDEVEKVIKWAIDAARLDPSPPSDTDDNDDSGEDADADDSGDEVDSGKKGKKK